MDLSQPFPKWLVVWPLQFPLSGGTFHQVATTGTLPTLKPPHMCTMKNIVPPWNSHIIYVTVACCMIIDYMLSHESAF